MPHSAVSSISIVVLNYRNPECTVECIESILELDELPQSVVLIDNGSGSASREFFSRRYGSSNLIAQLYLERNTGYAAGNNVGIRHLMRQNVDAICILNNDTIVRPGFIESLRTCFNSESRPDIVTPKILCDDGRTIWSVGERTVYTLLLSRSELGKPDHRCNTARTINSVTGCAMVARTAVFRRIGLLDENYFAYVEDVDFCKRSHDAGLRFAVCTKAGVIHKVGRTAGHLSPAQLYLKTRNRAYFIRKNIPAICWPLSFAWYFLVNIFWLVRSAWRKDRRSMLAILYGFSDWIECKMGLGRFERFISPKD